jgi:hypothetical protein
MIPIQFAWSPQLASSSFVVRMHPFIRGHLLGFVAGYQTRSAAHPRCFPGLSGPVVRNAATQRGMVTMRWGMSASTGWWFSPKTLGTRPRRIGGVGSSRRAGARRLPTALRNMRPTQTPRPKRTWSDSRSARTGRCLRSLASGPNSKATRRTRSKPIPGPHQVYNFLMTAPKAIVEPIHPKPMPPGHRGRMQMRTGWPRLTKLATMLRIVPAVQFVFAKFATLLRSKSGTARQRVSRRSVRRHQMHG